MTGLVDRCGSGDRKTDRQVRFPTSRGHPLRVERAVWQPSRSFARPASRTLMDQPPPTRLDERDDLPHVVVSEPPVGPNRANYSFDTAVFASAFNSVCASLIGTP